MAIKWGSIAGRMRVGIEVVQSPAKPTAKTTDVDLTVNVYWESDSYSFADDQRMKISGSAWSQNVDYRASSGTGANVRIKVASKTLKNQSIRFAGGPTLSWTATVSGAFNGGTPTVKATYTLPERPGDVPNKLDTPTISGITTKGATIKWGTANGNNGLAITQFQLQVDNNSGFGSPAADVTESWSTSRVIQSSLSPGVTYYSRVRARNAAGWGPWSGSKSFKTKPEKPARPGVSVGTIAATTAVLRVSGNGNGGAAISANGWRWGTSSALTGSADGTSKTASMTARNLKPATRYYVQSAQQNSAGWSTWSTTGSFTTAATTPDAPAKPTVSGETTTSARVSWKAPGNGGAAITGYDVQVYRQGQFNSTARIETSNSTPSHTLTLQAEGMDYVARVRAKNSKGAGPWSPEVEFASLSPTWVKVDGLWHRAVVWSRVNGAWRVVKPLKRADDGTWQT